MTKVTILNKFLNPRTAGYALSPLRRCSDERRESFQMRVTPQAPSALNPGFRV